MLLRYYCCSSRSGNIACGTALVPSHGRVGSVPQPVLGLEVPLRHVLRVPGYRSVVSHGFGSTRLGTAQVQLGTQNPDNKPWYLARVARIDDDYR
jgi:hypothetical protein